MGARVEPRLHDVLIYGATGTAGREVARYFSERARRQRDLRWAIAGRNPDKLDVLRRRLPSDVGVVVADADDADAIDAMVRTARVVLSTAGPFALHGEPLVGACARHGVDYVDITGETAHVRRLIDRYHRDAARSGAKIVPFCGFDSVPSDLGVLLIVDHFRRRGIETGGVKGFFRVAGGFSGGTVASTLELWRRPEDMRAMEDPFLLDPEDDREPDEDLENRDPSVPVLDPDLERWVAPFFMGPINTRVVRRSRALARRSGEDYGADFRYQEYLDPGSPMSFLAASGAAWGMAMFRVMSRVPGSGQLLAPLARSEGQRRAKRDDGFFSATFVGTGDDGSRVWATVADDSDPATAATAKFAAESALALALDRETLPGGNARAGLLTPATALGLPLVARLREAGMDIECPARQS